MCSIRREHHSQPKEFLERLTPFILEVDDLMKPIDTYPDGQDLQDVQWRTLIANKAGGLYNPPDRLGRAFRALKVLIQHIASGSNSNVPKPTDYQPLISFTDEMKGHQSQGAGNTPGELLEPFPGQLLQTLQGRKFCRTSNGYVGLVPAYTRPGDQVAVVAGSEVPFIVRHSLEREGAFILLGEAYIHGIMQGEVREGYDYQISSLFFH
jgi:hypothetical protein